MGAGRADPQGEGAAAGGVPADARRARSSSPTCTWPPAPELARGAPGRGRHRHRLRDGAAPRRQPAAAGADERGGRAPGGAGGRVLPRPRRTAAAASCWPACPACRPATSSVLGAGTVGVNAARIALGLGADVSILDINLDRLRARRRSLPRPRDHARCPTASTSTRCSRRADLLVGAVLRRRRPGAGARHQGDGGDHEGGLGDRGRGGGPGRQRRDDPPDHAARPDLPRLRRRPLRRGQHAGAGAAHLHLRADQRDAALRAGAGRARAWPRPCGAIPPLAKGVNVWRGRIVHPAVAQALGEPPTPLEALLG